MKSLFITILLLALTAGSSRAADNRHVVLITIDGFPAYMFWDAKASLPNIRRLADQGVAAVGMRVSNPTVTWPNHTTLVTGVRAAKHSVLYNGVLVHGGAGEPVKVDPRRDKSELVAVPTIYDLLHERGFRTAAIDWPCTRNSKALDDDTPDSPEPLSHTTPRLLSEMVARGILPDEKDATFRAMSGPERDEVWTRAACLVIGERQPNLLLLHLLNTDGTHHKYGPKSAASYTALALADSFVGRVVEAIDAAGIRTNTSIFVTADHGFAGATNILQPNVLLRQAGLLELNSKNQIAKARAQVVAEGGSGMVYLTNPATREADRKRVLEILSGQEGIAQIVAPAQYASFGFPSPEKNRGMPDLVIAAKDGYGISAAAAGDEFVVHATLQSNLGYHGYLATDPKMNATFVAAGRGIKHGVKIGLIDNIGVAPTIMHLLGEKLPGADGRVLSEILITPGE